MNVIYAVTAILLGVVIFLLAVPLELAFKIDRVREVTGRVKIRWLFGLVRFGIGIPGKDVQGKGKAPAKLKAKPPPVKRKKRRGSAKLFAVFRQVTFRRRLFKFIKDLLRATHAHEVSLRLRIGLGDPADTGQLWALLGPISAIAENIRSVVVRIEPEFMSPVFEIQGQGKFRLIPFQFILLSIAFILSPSSLNAWWSLRQRED